MIGQLTIGSQRIRLLGLCLVGIFVMGVAAPNYTGVTGLMGGTVVPKAVRDAVAAYLRDSSGSGWSFVSMKKDYHIDAAIKLSDIEAGVPVREYSLDMEKLQMEKEPGPVSAIVKQHNVWSVPIQNHGNLLYILRIRQLSQGCRIIAIKPKFKNWEQGISLWPKSLGYQPVLIHSLRELYFHFPQIDDYNLMLLTGGFKNPDSVELSFIESKGDGNPAYISQELKNRSLKMETKSRGYYLSDSRKIFKYLKKRQQEDEKRTVKSDFWNMNRR